MTPITSGLLRDDAVSVEVDIAPLPTHLPTVQPSVPTGVVPPPPGAADHGWLAATGFEPAWLLVGGAVIAVAVGLLLLRRRRRAWPLGRARRRVEGA